MNTIKKLLTGTIITLPLVMVATYSHANMAEKYETSGAKMQISTNGPMKLAPNSVEFLDFDGDISSIILSTPDILEISVQNSRKIMMRPIGTGATSLTVLSKDGKILYKRDIVVNDRHGKFVRIRRICADAGSDCITRGTYFCPDGCYEAIQGGGEGNGSSVGGSSANQSTSAPSNTTGTYEDIDEGEE